MKLLIKTEQDLFRLCLPATQWGGQMVYSSFLLMLWVIQVWMGSAMKKWKLEADEIPSLFF